MIVGVAAVDHALDLCMAKPHRSRRKAVGDVRFHVFVITYVTANSIISQSALLSQCRCPDSG